MSKTLVRVDNVSKDFILPHARAHTIKEIFTHPIRSRRSDTQHALRDISFNVKKGEFFGIVGRNGSGKSTLLKIIAGIYNSTSGSVRVDGSLVPFIELGVGFNNELSGRDNVYLNGALLGFSRSQMDKMYDEIVSFAELERFMDQKLKNYSSGMRVRLAFSIAIKADTDILLIDEVLAVGDANFQRKCFDYFRSLKTKSKTVIFVSHNLGAVQQYCDRAILIEKSKIIASGSSRAITSKYEKMLLRETKAKDTGKSKSAKGLSPSGEERWGDGIAEIKEVTAEVTDTAAHRDTITIKAKIKFKKDMESPIFGFSIKNYRFLQLLGTNTARKNIKLESRKAGDNMEITWRTPNVFNEGEHFVDCTIAHDMATLVSDRWPEATSFKNHREEQNPYPIYSPDIQFDIKRLKK